MIVDAHNDLLLELVLRREEPHPFATRWLPKLRAGGVALQVCPIYAGAEEPREKALALLEAFERVLRENPGDVVCVRTRGDLDALGGKKIGLMLALEGAEPVEDGFDEWWEAGVRMVALTWNRENAFTGGIDTPGQGLTERGRALVDELVACGAILDLAHASPRTFDEVLEHAEHVVVSHANCGAVLDIPRNLSDEQLRAVAARGGVVGMMALALVVDYDEPTIERWLDHFDPVVAVAGIEHVGLGADVIDQVTQTELELDVPLDEVVREALERGGGRLGLRDFTGPEHFPAVVAALRRRGYDGGRLDRITSANWLRVFRAALP